MNQDHQFWREWAESLHRWGVEDWAASLLEAAGPLSVLGAQVIYIGQPVFRGYAVNRQLEALAALLEDHAQTQAFAAFLREESSR